MKMYNIKQIEPEQGITECLYALKSDNRLNKDTILYANTTVEDLMMALTSAGEFINYTKFELGESWGT